MTDVKMARVQLLEKGSDADDLLREMVGYVAQRLMGLAVESLCGAARGERENWRNGYRDRARETRRERVNHTRCAFGSCAATATFRGV